MEGTTERQLTIIIIGRLIERLLLVGAGVFCVYIGYLLYVGGVSGDLKLKVESSGQIYQIENAAPGIVMALFGTLILIRTTMRPWERRIETTKGEKEVQFLSDSAELPTNDKHRLNVDEVTSLFRVTYHVLDRGDIDSELKTAMRNIYRKLYDRTTGLSEEHSPERLPKA